MFVLRYEKKDGTSEEFPLEKLPVIVGRLEGAGIRIADPSVSREHIRLFMRDEKLHLADLNSSNGTRVNGKKVTMSEVMAGDDIRLGTADLRLVCEAEELVRPVEQEAPPAPAEKTKPSVKPAMETGKPKTVPSPEMGDIKIKQDILQFHKKDPRKGRSFLFDDFAQYGGLIRLLIGILLIAVVVAVFFLSQWLGETMTPDGMGLDDEVRPADEWAAPEEE